LGVGGGGGIKEGVGDWGGWGGGDGTGGGGGWIELRIHGVTWGGDNVAVWYR